MINDEKLFLIIFRKRKFILNLKKVDIVGIGDFGRDIILVLFVIS